MKPSPECIFFPFFSFSFWASTFWDGWFIKQQHYIITTTYFRIILPPTMHVLSPAALVICQCFRLCDGFLHLFRIGTRACQPCDNFPPLQSSYPQNNSDTPHLHMGFGPSIPTPWVSGSSLHPTPPSPDLHPPSTDLCSAGAADRALPPSTELVLPPVILLLCPLSSVVWLFPGRWTYVCLFIPERIPMTDRPNNFIQVYFSDAVV